MWPQKAPMLILHFILHSLNCIHINNWDSVWIFFSFIWVATFHSISSTCYKKQINMSMYTIQAMTVFYPDSLWDRLLVFVWVIKVASHYPSFLHSLLDGQLTIHLSEFLKDWGLWPLQLTFIAKIIPSVCDILIFIKTGLSRRTCAVTNDEASQSKDTKGRHSCVF